MGMAIIYRHNVLIWHNKLDLKLQPVTQWHELLKHYIAPSDTSVIGKLPEQPTRSKAAKNIALHSQILP